MNLVTCYKQQEHKRREAQSFRGKRLTPTQVRLLEELKDKAIQGDLVDPFQIGVGRQSGKTTVLLKLAEEWKIPLVVHNRSIAMGLRKDYPDIDIIWAQGTRNLRGSRHREIITDEGVDISAVRAMCPGIRVKTGLIMDRSWPRQGVEDFGRIGRNPEGYRDWIREETPERGRIEFRPEYTGQWNL